MKEKLKKTVPVWVVLLLIGAMGSAIAVSYELNKTLGHQFGKMVFGNPPDLRLKGSTIVYEDANTVDKVEVSVRNTDSNKHIAQVIVTLEGAGITKRKTDQIPGSSTVTVSIDVKDTDIGQIDLISERLEQVS